MENTKNLYIKYCDICDEYAKKMCKMYEWRFIDCFWVSDKPGGVFCTSGIEYSLGMEDIITIVNNNVSYETFNEWWDYNQLISYAMSNHPDDSSFYYINLDKWLKGAPCNDTKEELQKEEKDYWSRYFPNKE